MRKYNKLVQKYEKIFWGPCTLYLQRLQVFFNMWKHLATWVNIAPMPLCCVSLLFLPYGTRDSYNGHKDYGIACVTTSRIYKYCFC